MLSLLLHLAITSYARANTLKRGIVKKAKRGVCVCAGVLSTYPVSVLCPSHSIPVLPDPSPRQEDMRHSATTGKACLWGRVSSVAGWCHQSPLLGPPGWMGTSLLGRQDGGLELRTYEWFPKSLQLRTKRSPWVGGKRVPMHSSSRARISPLF